MIPTPYHRCPSCLTPGTCDVASRCRAQHCTLDDPGRCVVPHSCARLGCGDAGRTNIAGLVESGEIVTVRPGPVLHLWRDGQQVAAMRLTVPAALSLASRLLDEVVRVQR